MGNSEKKKVDPRCIDRKSIRDMVVGKGLQHIATKPLVETDTVSASHEQTTVQKEQSGRVVGEMESLHGIRSEKRKSLHIDAGLHQQLSSLIWAIGSGNITMEGLANSLLTRCFEEYKDVLNAMTK